MYLPLDYPEEGSSTVFLNVGTYIPVYTASSKRITRRLHRCDHSDGEKNSESVNSTLQFLVFRGIMIFAVFSLFYWTWHVAQHLANPFYAFEFCSYLLLWTLAQIFVKCLARKYGYFINVICYVVRNCARYFYFLYVLLFIQVQHVACVLATQGRLWNSLSIQRKAETWEGGIQMYTRLLVLNRSFVNSYPIIAQN